MDNFLGEIRIFAGNYAPAGWALCNGALQSINSETALFSLLGTTYGGDGITTFALPDFRVRIGVGMGQLAGGGNYIPGEIGGAPQVTLLPGNTASHTHSLMASNTPATTGDPTNNFLAQTNGNDSTVQPPYPDVKLYTTLPLPSGPSTPNVTLDVNSLSMTGGTQPHDNMMPYVCINYIIALNGIFPSFQ
ncbi:Microcystin-dependent protein [Chitinophaga sp. CF118]|uniref:phage tail protein n=1 Tax=Chitinophaga sp. CF118 TaxID=1884367 RepID=UPI0008EDE610|nr:tail fiber protein [Chitinophaga sp. CF118]SFD15477.1 Microcystin-dependent protein [Chitinophaga sp. CF118]